MANTTYMNLGKLAGTENMKTYPPVQADNADKIDAGFGASFDAARNVKSVTDALADAIAIVATGNTHAAITAGQYVYVKQHNSLSEGLYVATSNIAANATLSGSNLTADSSGGLNSVYSALNGNLNPLTTSKSWSDFTKPTLSNGTHYGDGCHYIKVGCFVAVIISVQFDSPPSNALLWTMPSGYIPVGNVDISASGGGSYNAKAQCTVNSSGGVRVTSVDKWVTGYGIYIVA